MRTLYAKPGSSEQTIDLRDNPQCPDGYIEIQQERPEGKFWICTPQGQWEKDNQAILDKMSEQRNQLLTGSDWLILSHEEEKSMGVPNTMSDQEYQATLVWRKQLRDIVNR
ncbi:MAG: hypothetical protein LPD71_00170 [Shewanella sp.]|nr:hypothetical protein [Shewanella sp.]MCF1457213.1 hypothetical protein [Shewanella sp.]